MVTVEYDHNNSGGSWWLTDQNWLDLESAGWEVDWYANDPDGWGNEDGRFLGALATKARKTVERPEDAIGEWERVTGMSPYDEGCNCCGVPHSFSYEDEEGREHYTYADYGPVSMGWT